MVGRHACSDIYRATELRAPGKGKVTISYQPEGGRPAQTLDVIDFGKGDPNEPTDPQQANTIEFFAPALSAKN